ncbi:hypothetical protein BGZ61DRAFT_469988 [Ilyonectria robusta]|uniref:uncharacterized protein n=1 Tax=Ilyonectria robusta TaxID=1079257 RepID=UPI001E8DDE07|nr:uncharacterized protein BGZ61DRAFT_469988 [Ilyonectria robusta]KAH8646517.1 hypothetical protein BGZ61DRAFT_469988 [Ilyonectria robusta]
MGRIHLHKAVVCPQSPVIAAALRKEFQLLLLLYNYRREDMKMSTESPMGQDDVLGWSSTDEGVSTNERT